MKKTIMLSAFTLLSFVCFCQSKKQKPSKTDSIIQRSTGYYLIAPLSGDDINKIIYAIQRTGGMTGNESTAMIESIKKLIRPIQVPDTIKTRIDSITNKK